MTYTTQCQSCGMPLTKDPSGKGGGTNADGTISAMYCSLCYQNGEFCAKNVTVEQFQNIVEAAMKKNGHNRFMRKLARIGIPHLDRWSKKK